MLAGWRIGEVARSGERWFAGSRLESGLKEPTSRFGNSLSEVYKRVYLTDQDQWDRKTNAMQLLLERCTRSKDRAYGRKIVTEVMAGLGQHLHVRREMMS